MARMNKELGSNFNKKILLPTMTLAIASTGKYSSCQMFRTVLGIGHKVRITIKYVKTKNETKGTRCLCWHLRDA